MRAGAACVSACAAWRSGASLARSSDDLACLPWQAGEGARVGRLCVLPVLLAAVLPGSGVGALPELLRCVASDAATGQAWALLFPQARRPCPVSRDHIGGERCHRAGLDAAVFAGAPPLPHSRTLMSVVTLPSLCLTYFKQHILTPCVGSVLCALQEVCASASHGSCGCSKGSFCKSSCMPAMLHHGAGPGHAQSL